MLACLATNIGLLSRLPRLTDPVPRVCLFHGFSRKDRGIKACLPVRPVFCINCRAVHAQLAELRRLACMLNSARLKVSHPGEVPEWPNGAAC